MYYIWNRKLNYLIVGSITNDKAQAIYVAQGLREMHGDHYDVRNAATGELVDR